MRKEQKVSQKMQQIKIMTVFGTRPEAIKMAPLIKEIESRGGMSNITCVTAQHREMLDQVLEVFGILPDYDLNIMKKGQTLSSITSDIILNLTSIIEKAGPDLVLVHGDTTTSFAAALSSFYAKKPVGHVEAGLRTYNKLSPYPEEMNRTLITHIADMHFAPTQNNAHNLRKENACKNVYVTGNTVIDALFSVIKDDYIFQSDALRNIDFNKRIILLTAHRRENFGEPLRQIFEAVIRIADAYEDVEFIYPLHRNPNIYDAAHAQLCHPRIHLIDPLRIDEMHNLMNRSHLILTDSGGLQEEAPSLGKPVLVLRKETERPEAVEIGTVRIAGTDTTEIVKQTELLLENAEEYQKMARASNPYGDGHASKRICDAI